MTVAPEADTEVVTGTVQGIVQKAADKWQIEVNIGQQNPRRLWTKDAGLVSQMATMIGQHLSFMCGVSHWTNQQQQPVRSLWINGYGQAGQVQQPVPAPPQVPVQPQQSPMQPAQPMPVPQQWPAPAQQDAPVSAAVREERILREAASGVAVQLLKHLHPDDQNFGNLIKLSERLVGYYKDGAQWGGGGSQGSPSADGDPGPQGVPHTDDDIPF